MNGRVPRRGRDHPRSPQPPTEQPDHPAREVRLLDVSERGDEVVFHLDDGTALELAPGSVPADLPGCGEVLSAGQLAALRLAAERKQVARLIFAQLDRRLQPTARIRDKLTDKGYSEAAVTAVLEQMAAKGIYSDQTFAEAYCRDCLAGRAVGRRYLVARLREKRVSAPVASAAVEAVLDRETEEALADRAARARWERIRGPADLKNLAKVVRHLQGRGFDAGAANRAARAARPARRHEAERDD